MEGIYVYIALTRQKAMELWDVDSPGRDFSHGIVKFVPDGLQLHNLNGKEESRAELRG